LGRTCLHLQGRRELEGSQNERLRKKAKEKYAGKFNHKNVTTRNLKFFLTFFKLQCLDIF
jgi:hypothetical protein